MEVDDAGSGATGTTENQRNECDVERLLEHLSCQTELFSRHQHRSDPDMSREDRLMLLRVQLDEDPDDFLSRYYRQVPPDLADCLQLRQQQQQQQQEKHCEATEADALRRRYYLAEIRRAGRPAQRSNRRYQAMQRLVAAGEYFSDESMRHREPYLYHKYIGRYEATPAASGAALGPQNPDRVMSHFLMRHCDRVEENARYDAAAAAAAASGADSNSDSEDEEEEASGAKFLPQRERQLLRAEFTSIMQRRFLSGEDTVYFDYASVDNDDSLDVSQQYLQDAEDSYFDSEEPS